MSVKLGKYEHKITQGEIMMIVESLSVISGSMRGIALVAKEAKKYKFEIEPEQLYRVVMDLDAKADRVIADLFQIMGVRRKPEPE